MEETIWEKYLRPGMPLGVFLVGGEGIGGQFIEMDGRTMALRTEGPEGVAIVLVEKREVRMITVSMVGEH